MNVTLYSTDCPKCKVLKRKLKEKCIEHKTNCDIDEMLERGIRQVPVLEINGEIFDFKKAIEWVNQQE